MVSCDDIKMDVTSYSKITDTKKDVYAKINMTNAQRWMTGLYITHIHILKAGIIWYNTKYYNLK